MYPFVLSYASVGEPLSLAIIDAFLYLGRKYDINILHTEALKRLYHEFPATLGEKDSTSKWTMIKEPESPIEIVMLAHRNGLLSVLPYVLYCCCVDHSAHQIKNGVELDDGSVVMLSLEDQCACLVGHHTIINAQANTIYSWIYTDVGRFSPLYPQCSKRGVCIPLRREILLDYFTPIPSVRGLNQWEDRWEPYMCKY